MRQKDLFDAEPQDDLFDGERPEKLYAPAPEKVRQELMAVLAQAKSADTLPWTREKLRFHQTVFPQMSKWLPEDEAAQLCFEFECELKRLLAA